MKCKCIYCGKMVVVHDPKWPGVSPWLKTHFKSGTRKKCEGSQSEAKVKVIGARHV